MKNMCYIVDMIYRKGCVTMKMQAVTVDGFKNLSNVKIIFDDITALVALNNFGKSNVLLGIDFGLSFVKATLEDKLDMVSNANLIPTNQKMLGRNYKFEVEVLTALDNKEYRVQYGYEFSWKYEEDREPQIVSEYLRAKAEEKGQKYTQLITRTSDTALYKSSETGRCSSKIKVESLELVINKLRAYDDIYCDEIIRKINGIKIDVENRLRIKNYCKSDYVTHKNIADLKVDKDNLPQIIYQLKDKFWEKYELLKDAYSQLFPDVEDIIVEQYIINGTDKLPKCVPFVQTSPIYVLYVKYKNLVQPINFTMLSGGARRAFMTLTKVILSNVSDISLIAIEELENSVYPNLLQRYIRIINQLCNECCKIIIISHSPYVIGCLEPAFIYVGMNLKPGVAEFFRFKKSGQKQLLQDARNFNMSMGEYIFSLLADTENNLAEYLEH